MPCYYSTDDTLSYVWNGRFCLKHTILVSAIWGARPLLLLSPSPHLPNVRVHSHVSLLRINRKFWASKVMYRGSAADFSAVLCTPTAAAVGTTAAGSPLFLSLTSPPRPRFFAGDPLKLCWSTPRRGQPSSCHYKPKKVAMAFVERFPGLHETIKKSAAEPRYTTFEAQNFLLNKVDTWLCTLTFGDGDSSGLAPQIIWRQKRPHSRLASTDDTLTFGIYFFQPKYVGPLRS